MDVLNALIEKEFSHRKDDILIINKVNEGLPLARKTGLDNATGEYILFADSDDWMELDAVQKVMAKADETDADIIYFDLVKEYGAISAFMRARTSSSSPEGPKALQSFLVSSFILKPHLLSQGFPQVPQEHVRCLPRL